MKFNIFSRVGFVFRVFTFTLIFYSKSPASAEPISAVIVRPFGGTGLAVREGTNRTLKDFQYASDGSLFNELRKFQDTLEIQGDNRSGARLSFTDESSVVVDYGGLSIQTRPSRNLIEYRFPCGTSKGSFTIGWRFASESRDRACNDGVRVGPSGVRQATELNNRQIEIFASSKEFSIAQTYTDDVLVAPRGPEQLLVDTVDNGNSITIIPIIGDSTITSAQFPSGQILRQGQQYTYFGNGEGRIENVNLQPIINSPHIRDFLNPSNWSPSSGLPARISNQTINQLQQCQTALNSSIASVPQASSCGLLEWVCEHCSNQTRKLGINFDERVMSNANVIAAMRLVANNLAWQEEDSAAIVKALQTALSRLTDASNRPFYTAPIDGVYSNADGPWRNSYTANAVRNFQIFWNNRYPHDQIPVDGLLGTETAQRLVLILERSF